MKLKLAATAAAVLATGLLSQSARANAALPNTQYDATLEVTTPQSPEFGDSFVIRSSAVLQTSGPNIGKYYYSYDFGVSGDVNKKGPIVPIQALSVYFDTVGTGAYEAGGYSGTSVPATTQMLPGNVGWAFNPVSEIETVYFFSPDAPGFGYATAQNGGTWNQVDNSSALQTELSGSGMDPDSLIVVPIVPSVPDSATTLSLLGGAIVGLGALRRKIGC